MPQLHKTSTMGKTAVWVSLHTQNDMYKEIYIGEKCFHMSFLAQKLACMCFTGPLQWQKLVSMCLLATWKGLHSCKDPFLCLSYHLNWKAHASRGLHRCKKLLSASWKTFTENSVPQLHKSSIMVKNAPWISLDTQRCMNKLCRTSIVVKNAL